MNKKNPCKLCLNDKKLFLDKLKSIIIEKKNDAKNHPDWTEDMITGFNCATLILHYAISQYEKEINIKKP